MRLNTEGKIPSVYGTMKKILIQINSPQEQKNLKGNLAVIRNSIGKNYEDGGLADTVPAHPPGISGHRSADL